MIPQCYPQDANGNMKIAYISPTSKTAWVDYIPVGSQLNGSFETGDNTGWNLSSRATIVDPSAVDAVSGTFVAQLAAGDNPVALINTQLLPISPGDIAYFSLRANQDGAADVNLFVAFNFYDAEENVVGSDSEGFSFSVISDWTHLINEGTAPAGATQFRARSFRSTTSAAGNFFVDQCCIGKLTEKTRHEQNGWIPVNVLSSTSGLTAFVDYIPAVFVNNEDNEKRWTTDSGGFIPIVEVTTT